MAGEIVRQDKDTAVKQVETKSKKSFSVMLTEALEDVRDALPPDFNRPRFVQNSIALLNEHAELQEFNRAELKAGLLKASYLGLDFYNGECYLLPYYNRDKGAKELNFQIDYKGMLKLAKKYSRNKIRDIYAKVVREGDKFEVKIENGRQIINFYPDPFSNAKIKGVFAICLYEDGSMIYDIMSEAEVEETRNNFSKAANSKAWKNSWPEMAKKTVLRRLCKLIDLDMDNYFQIKAYEDGSPMEVHVEEEKATAQKIDTQDPFQQNEQIQDEQIIEAEAFDITEQGE